MNLNCVFNYNLFIETKHFSYESANGIKVQEEGELKNKGNPETEAQSAVGKNDLIQLLKCETVINSS